MIRTLCKKDARDSALRTPGAGSAYRTSDGGKAAPGLVICRISPLERHFRPTWNRAGIDLARTRPPRHSRAHRAAGYAELRLEGRKPPRFRVLDGSTQKEETMTGRFAVRLALIGLLAAGAVVGCSNDDSSTGPETGVLSVRITDAPAQFDQVNLVVTQVAVFRGSTLPADSDSVSGWSVIRTSSVTVD